MNLFYDEYCVFVKFEWCVFVDIKFGDVMINDGFNCGFLFGMNIVVDFWIFVEFIF